MKIFKNHLMKEFSNMKIGGYAKELIIIEKKEEISEVLKEKDNIFLIGNGTNTLISDENLDKTFVSLKQLEEIKELGDGRVQVQSGLDFNKFLNFLAKNNYGGLENLAGIPGSVGGLVYMNGGAYGTEIFDCIEAIEIADNKGNIKTISKENIYFDYRKTEIQQKKWIVLSTIFKFKTEFDVQKIHDLREKRKGNHPLDMPNLGSTFKNPKGNYAAVLIINAGMQGVKVGDAQVSLKHPNFIVNLGNATFSDIRKLIQMVKDKVKETSGIELEEEIITLK